MQSLGAWTSCGVSFLTAPHLEVGAGSSSVCYGKDRDWRRKKSLDCLDSVFLRKRSDVLVVSGGFGLVGLGGVLGVGFELGGRTGFYCKCKPLPFLGSKRGDSGSLVPLGSALDHQEVASELAGAVSGLDDGVLETRVVEPGGLDSPDGCQVRGTGEKDNGGVAHGNGGIRAKDSLKIDARSLARSLYSAKTVEDVEEVLKDKGILPLQVYSRVIKGLGLKKKMDSALALVEWLKRKKAENGGHAGPNLFIYNSLLGAVRNCERFGETEKILIDMKLEKVVPDLVTYNTLMVIFVQLGQPKRALNMIEMMRSEGIAPCAASYSSALMAYRGMEDGNGALQLFLEIKEKYGKGEIGRDNDDYWQKEFPKLENYTIRVCYQVMRRWLVRKEDLSGNVLKLLVEIDKAGLQPDRTENERLVWACTREVHYAVARELYNRIRERHGEISLSVCNHVIWNMGKARKWWTAMEIFEDLLDKGPHPNILSNELIIANFSTLLTAAEKTGTWKRCISLLNKMEDKGLRPGAKEWNAVLIACAKASATDAAVQVFGRMVERGEKPTIVSYGALLKALKKGKLYDEAARVWEHMLKIGIQPNLYVYTTMASVFAAQGNVILVDSMIQEMTSSGIKPTVVTYNAIISECARGSLSLIGAAYEWFHRMQAQNITPNEVTYEIMIQALAKDGKPRLAYNLYLRARNEGLGLSSRAYDAILDSSRDYQVTIDMDVLGPRPLDEKKWLDDQEILNRVFRDFADAPRRSRPF